MVKRKDFVRTGSCRTHVHRFGDRVGIALMGDDKGTTQYLCVKQARAVARALGIMARSIETEEFSQSTCRTITVDLVGNVGGPR